uniref:Uncharacterized protein n=1 Tax=Apteryx owenii TaxID=8824 RepID=A0A8B9S9W0_APTOW
MFWVAAEGTVLALWLAILALPLLCTSPAPGANMALCPSNCSCAALQRFVSCANASLAWLPAGLPHATVELDLQHNLFPTLEAGFFPDLPALTTLYLGSSRWRCDCSLVWLWTWQRKRPRGERGPVACSSPGALLGQLLADVEVRLRPGLRGLRLAAQRIVGLHLLPTTKEPHDTHICAPMSLTLLLRFSSPSRGSDLSL